LSPSDEEKDTGQFLALMGSYLNAVVWLANKLGEFDVAFAPGDVILAGSFTSIFSMKAMGK
jgi:2-keto-4-pentenoate hydratase